MRKNNHNSKQLLQKKTRDKFGWIAVLICWVVLAGVLTFLQRNSQAQSSNATISVSPTSGTYTVGSQINIAVRVNASTDFNYAGVYLLYTSNTMEYLGTTFGSSFNGTPNTLHTGTHPSAGTYVSLADFRRSGTGGLRGTHNLATVRFRVKRAGSGKASLTFGAVENRPNKTYNVSFTNGSYTFVNPAPVDVCPNISGTQTTVPSGYVKNSAGNCVRRAPAPSTPTPRPTAPIRPSANTNAPITQGSIKLTKLKVSNIGYQTSQITWSTNQSSSTVIEYGLSKDNLSDSKTSKNGKSHKINFTQADKLAAGTTYYFKVTSKNGNQTATATGSFTTKPVPVIILVTDIDNKPLSEATVSIGEVVGVTNEKGEIQLALPSGYQLIIARKGDLYREIDTQILIPSDSDTPKQRITLNLGVFDVEKEADNESKKTNTSSAWLWSFLLIPLLVVGATLLILFLRRRKDMSDDYIGGDILEAENYTPQPAPSPVLPPVQTSASQETTPFITQSDASVPQYASLPELVGRYASDQAVQNQPTPSSPPPSSSPWSPTAQAPQHSSIKDMVVIPSPERVVPYQLPENDLPVSPLPPPTGVIAPQDTENLPPRQEDWPPQQVAPLQSQDEDNQNSITIEH